MTVIDGIGRPTPASPARRSRATAGFALPADAPAAADAPTAADSSVPVFAAFMGSLLGLQEQAPDAPSVRDREARRHGQALLSALAEMQLTLTGSGDFSASLASLAERLSALADTLPIAADPRLRAIVAAITLRARVELARRSA